MDIACGRSFAPMPQCVTEEGKQNDEEKPQPSGTMADEQATPETVELDATEHHQDRQSRDVQTQVNSVDAKYQKLRTELYEDRKTFRPKILSMQPNYWLPLAENLLKGLATRILRNGLRVSSPVILCTRISQKRNKTAKMRDKMNQKRNRSRKKSAMPVVRLAGITALR